MDMSTILIIEDDPNIRKLLSINLAVRGYTVVQAEDAHTGLERLRDSAPDVLLLDLKLPDMPGWEVLRIMTEDPTFHAIPVIIITASLTSTHADAVVVKSEHLRKILKKPISIQELTQEVREALN
jgi:two-component system KDP operon response regulator KdpE